MRSLGKIGNTVKRKQHSSIAASFACLKSKFFLREDRVTGEVESEITVLESELIKIENNNKSRSWRLKASVAELKSQKSDLHDVKSQLREFSQVKTPCMEDKSLEIMITKKEVPLCTNCRSSGSSSRI